MSRNYKVRYYARSRKAGRYMNENRGLWHAKRLDTGEWVEGYYVCISGCHHYIYTGKFVCGANEMIHHPEMLSVDPLTLGECTGLTDKNGKLIFEGDIIEHKGERYVIKYIEKYMRFSPVKPGTVFAVFDYTQSVIIGNIHDNPELLRRATGEDIGNAAQGTIAPAT